MQRAPIYYYPLWQLIGIDPRSAFNFRLVYTSLKGASMPAVTIITAQPLSITPEEYNEASQTTPLSFSDIPPVLRLKAENIRISFKPSLTDLSEEELSKGTLYVIERYVFYAREILRACHD